MNAPHASPLDLPLNSFYPDGGTHSSDHARRELRLGVRRDIIATGTSSRRLLQSLLVRILTPLETRWMAQKQVYGSRLYQIIGAPNNQETRDQAHLYILQAIDQEPLVSRVISIRVSAHVSDPHRMDIDLLFVPSESRTPLNLVFPYYLSSGS